jgi:drug/metabolite transporter (DMT)-like permease
MKAKKLVGNLLLLLTAIIWGSGFVAQRAGMEFVGPLTFGASRFWLAFLVLIPVVHFMNKVDQKALAASGKTIPPKTPAEIAKSKKTFWTASILCGTMLFCGSILQQFGMVFTTAGKAAFITALYILLVPVFSLVLKHRPSLTSWIGVACGTIGLYLLCITESFTIAMGDFIVLIGAVFWACHVLFIDHFLPYVNPAKLAMTQFGICAMYSTIGMLIFERPSWSAVATCAVPILYAGIMSGGMGFTLQIFGQRYTSPTVASLLLSMEAVFGAIFGFLLLHEVMSSRELTGCFLMFGAIIISQLPDKKSGAKEAQNENL